MKSCNCMWTSTFETSTHEHAQVSLCTRDAGASCVGVLHGVVLGLKWVAFDREIV
ncbi:hypothetical protein MA16_Dca006699 [Dendrobium catenatum]|uniref:Uncharacterized protein n=1 Tax=Dendrobium catenatum TaxID=906689 RepID=A0A2I0W8W0_9ASPA|nr:hypothetical protein MA16_Dca006699 [Dendrobium catenatum]